MIVIIFKILLVLCTFVNNDVLARKSSKRPNIIFIVADDLGWDDVSFHGSDQIHTPNIDLLAYTGVALERLYSHCICTPSRSALLTGKFAHIIGMQGYPLTNSEDRGLPTTEKILPQYLKETGYATNLVGKWHVGQSRTEYLPTNRGFDSHFGHRGGFVDYYEYTLEENQATGDVTGFGLFRNESVAWDVEGYLTDVYNREAISVIRRHNKSTPLFLMVGHNAPHSANAGSLLQAPPEEIRKMRHIESPNRRIYAAMVKKLDDSVGDITQALLEKGMLDNTVIVFMTDNGGMTSGNSINYASNWPLRGLKMSPFEGGTRLVGLVWSAYNFSNHVWNGYMHSTDWLPTLLGLAGVDPPQNISGTDQWHNIKFNKISNRKEFFDIDDYTGFASFTSGDFKLLTGNVVIAYSDYQGGELRGIIGEPPSYIDAIKNSKLYNILDATDRPFNLKDINLRHKMKINCRCGDRTDICFPQNGTVCLYNIKEDPCETEDLSNIYPEIVERMTVRLNEELYKTISRKVPLFRDPRSAPRLFNYTWDVWADNID